ncbi:MAG: hypothetical protein Q9160_007197 [Pyrenula sp. 1 TL-2023]
MQFTPIASEVHCKEEPFNPIDSTFGFSPKTSPAKDVGDGGDLSGDDLNSWSGLNDIFFQPKTQPIPPAMANPCLVTNSAMSHYGQITPPMDNSPSYNSPPKTTIETNPPPTSKQPRKQRKTQQTNNTASAQSEDQPARRRRTASRKSSAATNGESADDKRNKFLERNRVAASKCRQKKKQWTESLEDDHRNQQSFRRMLIEQKDAAQQEILYLKNMLLTHADCHHPDLDHWLRNTASTISHTGSEAADQPNPESTGGMGIDFDTYRAPMYDGPSSSEHVYNSPDSTETLQQPDHELAMIEQNLVGSLTQDQSPRGSSGN